MDQRTELRSITLSESESRISDHIRNLGTPTDFNILCGNTVFRAHQAVLGAKSNYLLELFMKQPNGYFNFILDESQPMDVENLLTYVYQAKVAVNPAKAQGFYLTAMKLKIDALIEDAAHEEELESVRTSNKAIMGRATKTILQETEPDVVDPEKSPRPAFKIPDVPIKKNNPGFKKPKKPTTIREPQATFILENKDDVNSSMNKPIALKTTTEVVEAPGVVFDPTVPKLSKEIKKSRQKVALDNKTLKGSQSTRHKITEPQEAKAYQSTVGKKPDCIPQEEEPRRANKKSNKGEVPSLKAPLKRKYLDKNFQDLPKLDSNPVGFDKEVPPNSIQPVVNVRGILGRPILSSTKLNSSKPLIPDKLKVIQTARVGNTLKAPDTTFLVPETPVLKKRRRRPGLGKLSPPPEPFCVTDLVNQIEEKKEKQKIPKRSLLKRLKKKLPLNPLTTTEDHELTTFRGKQKSTIRVVNLVQATDDSTDGFKIIGEIRKKKPIGSRRRVPASTRPMIYSTTTTSISLRRSLRTKYTRNEPSLLSIY